MPYTFNERVIYMIKLTSMIGNLAIGFVDFCDTPRN